jgi:circadian clock protein KaiB
LGYTNLVSNRRQLTAHNPLNEVMNRSSHFKFRLYVADGPNSEQAVANLSKLCRDLLPERYEIELVDVRREPQRALDDGVLLAPLLVKFFPEPIRKISGSLSRREELLKELDFAL